MGMYTGTKKTDSASFEETTLANTNSANEFREAVILDELCNKIIVTEEDAKEFLGSEEFKVMCETGILTEALATTVVMSKLDDLSRRTKLAAMQLARDNDDALYKKYIKHKAAERELEDAMMKKYKSGATKDAKMAQKEYIKLIPNAFRKRVTIS